MTMALLPLLLFILFKRTGYKMTQLQALTQCLVLAITAPTDEQSERANELAQQIAQGLTQLQVEQCKLDALNMLESV